MAKSSRLTGFSQNVIDYNHHTADYYENKKYMFLKMSVTLLGFSATIIALFGSDPMFKIGALGLLVSSVLSLLSFAVFSLPTSGSSSIFRSDSYIKENTLDVYSKKFKKLTEKNILDENLKQSVYLLNTIRKKKKVISTMSFFMTIGLVFFFLAVFISAI